MANTDEIRWRQRLANYEKALAQLNDACGLESYTPLERAGLVQMFEFSFELAWKVLKDLLFYEGYDEKTPREVLRRAFETEYLDEADGETLLDALLKRNLLSHTYEERIALEAEELIRKKYAPALRRLGDRLREKSLR
jgi:nucleotidyltransferase substrate binding protein (TIGR01987 family)